MPKEKHLKAFRLAMVFTVVAIAASVGPNVGRRYDPSLAVLTLTLIAIIWYTYFTYQAVNPYSEPIIVLSVTGRVFADHAHLTPVISNQSPNRIRLRLALDVWFGGIHAPLDEFYTGQTDVLLDPREIFTGNLALPVPDSLTPAPDVMGDLRAKYDEFRVIVSATWRDEYETGSVGPKYFIVDVEHSMNSPSHLFPVIGEAQIRTFFSGFNRTTLPEPVKAG